MGEPERTDITVKGGCGGVAAAAGAGAASGAAAGAAAASRGRRREERISFMLTDVCFLVGE